MIVLNAGDSAHVQREGGDGEHGADLESALHDLHAHHYGVFLVKDVLGQDLQHAGEGGDLDGLGTSVGRSGGVEGLVVWVEVGVGR